MVTILDSQPEPATELSIKIKSIVRQGSLSGTLNVWRAAAYPATSSDSAAGSMRGRE